LALGIFPLVPRQIHCVPNDPLHRYPYVLVRIGCDVCQRSGRYRLARLAEKYGADINLEDLLARLTADCGASNPRHPVHRECQARFIDLDPPRRPPDMPARQMRVVQGGRR
jgi:hypothetical protein